MYGTGARLQMVLTYMVAASSTVQVASDFVMWNGELRAKTARSSANLGSGSNQKAEPDPGGVRNSEGTPGFGVPWRSVEKHVLRGASSVGEERSGRSAVKGDPAGPGANPDLAHWSSVCLAWMSTL